MRRVFFLSSLLELVGFRRSVKSTYSFHFRSTSCTSFCAQINSLIYCPTNSTTKLKGFHLSLSTTSRLMVLLGFLLSDSVEREHQPPLIFSRYFKNVRATIKMNGEFSEFSHRLCHKATSLLYVLSSGNIRKGFFACLLIIDHDISAAAEQNKKVGGGGGWVAENKIGNSVSERKNFTPMWSHVFKKKGSWSRIQQN